MKRIKVFFALTALIVVSVYAKEKQVAAPMEKISYQRLFAITRSVNSNQVIYEAALGKNGFYTEAPLKIYWIVYEDGAKTAPLSKLQEKLGYGVTVATSSTVSVVFKVKALPEKPIRVDLISTPEGVRPRALIDIRGEGCVIDRIFIESRSAFPLPKVVHIDIEGISLKTGERVTERVKPDQSN